MAVCHSASFITALGKQQEGVALRSEAVEIRKVPAERLARRFATGESQEKVGAECHRAGSVCSLYSAHAAPPVLGTVVASSSHTILAFSIACLLAPQRSGKETCAQSFVGLGPRASLWQKLGTFVEPAVFEVCSGRLIAGLGRVGLIREIGMRGETITDGRGEYLDVWWEMGLESNENE